MSETAPSPALEGHRNYVTTATDHGGVAVTISTLMATWAVLCFIVRIYMRMTVSGPFGLDDYVCGIATIFGIVQMIVSCVAVSFGFGKALALLDQQQLVSAEKAVYVAQLLYIVTNTLTKACVALLLARIVFIKSKVRACYAVLVAAGLWGFASFLAEAIRCSTDAPWALVAPRCPNYLLGWQVITAFDVIIEILLFALPIWLVWGLQTDIGRKVTVVAFFALRLPVIAAALVRLHFLRRSIESSEPLFNGVIPFICLNVEMFYGLMAATMPTLKPFVSAFNTGWGTYDTTGRSGYGGGSAVGSYAMRSLPNNRKSGSNLKPSRAGSRLDSNSVNDGPIAGDNALRPTYGNNVTHVRATAAAAAARAKLGDPARSSSSSSAESKQQMIIRQTLTCEVRFEDEEKGTEGGIAALRPSEGDDSIGSAPSHYHHA